LVSPFHFAARHFIASIADLILKGEVIKKKYHRGIEIRKARTANSTYQQLAVQWFIENLC
jgi:hypothetical protein